MRPNVKIPIELGKIQQDIKLVEELGWVKFIKQRQSISNLKEMQGLWHPVRYLVHLYTYIHNSVLLTTSAYKYRIID